MAIKFENVSDPQPKPAEKRAEATRASDGEEDSKKGEAPAEESEDDHSPTKAKKPRAGFKKK